MGTRGVSHVPWEPCSEPLALEKEAAPLFIAAQVYLAAGHLGLRDAKICHSEKVANVTRERSAKDTLATDC